MHSRSDRRSDLLILFALLAASCCVQCGYAKHTDSDWPDAEKKGGGSLLQSFGEFPDSKRGSGRSFAAEEGFDYKRGGGRAFQFSDGKRGGGRAFAGDGQNYKRGGGRAFQFSDDKRGGGRAFQFSEDKRGGGRAFVASDKRAGGRGFQSTDSLGKRGRAHSFSIPISSYYGEEKRAGARPFYGSVGSWWKRGGGRYFADNSLSGMAAGFYEKRSGARHFNYEGMKRGGARSFSDWGSDQFSPAFYPYVNQPMKKAMMTTADSSLGSPFFFYRNGQMSPSQMGTYEMAAGEAKRAGARTFSGEYSNWGANNGQEANAWNMKRAGARVFPNDDESKEKRRMMAIAEPQQ